MREKTVKSYQIRCFLMVIEFDCSLSESETYYHQTMILWHNSRPTDTETPLSITHGYGTAPFVPTSLLLLQYLVVLYQSILYP